MGLFRLLSRKNGKKIQKVNTDTDVSKVFGDYQGIHLDKSLDNNIKSIKTIFRDCDDIVYRPFKIAKRFKAELVYMDGMVKIDAVDNFVMKPLMLEYGMAGIEVEDEKKAFLYAKEAIISTANIKESKELEKVLHAIMIGAVVIFIERNESALIVEAKGWEQRQVEAPQDEVTVRGPRDAFTENIRTNSALIRRRICDPKLKLKGYLIGRRSKTRVEVMYIEDIANPRLVEEVFNRIENIDVDSVVGNGLLEQLMEDNWISPFPQFMTTERPDRVTAALLEGKVCILIDNSSMVSVLPATMNDLLTAPDDYYERWMVATLIRIVRLTGAVASTVLPALYIAMVSFHPEMIPSALALSIASGREGVPFPAFVEAFLMEGSFELMREAGIRLPGSLGQTMGVVGAVVIGQAAVSAGIVSPVMVVVVALTGIANFTVPSFDVALSYRLLRFGLMILSAVLGLYGLILGLLLILSHICILKSFGTPYLAPWIPLNLKDLKDTVLRAPWQYMSYRPSYMHTQDKKRSDLDKVGEHLKRRKGE